MIAEARALGELLEPGGDVAIEVLDVEPLTWEPEHLYMIVSRWDEEPFESGPSVIQDADIRAVYVTSNEREEARKRRDPELAAFLDGKVESYLATVRRNQLSPHWYSARGARVTSPRTLDKRGAAVNVRVRRITD
jgi:hypothetical protein